MNNKNIANNIENILNTINNTLMNIIFEYCEEHNKNYLMPCGINTTLILKNGAELSGHTTIHNVEQNRKCDDLIKIQYKNILTSLMDLIMSEIIIPMIVNPGDIKAYNIKLEYNQDVGLELQYE